MATGLPAAVSEGIFISKGAAAEVITYANLLAALGMSFIDNWRCQMLGGQAGRDMMLGLS